jgi:hypothetical protein
MHGVEMYVTSCPSNAPILVAIRVTRDVQEIDVEALNVSNQCSNISFTGATLIFLSMINKSYVLSSKQSHGNPTMHEPQSRMVNIHISRLKLANHILTRNYSPKFKMIKTLESMV